MKKILHIEKHIKWFKSVCFKKLSLAEIRILHSFALDETN